MLMPTAAATPHPVAPAADALGFTVAEAACRLGATEAEVREWLTTFNRERRFDGTGRLWLAAADVEFLSLVKALRDVDRSCASITRMIAPAAALAGDPGLPVAPELQQLESLKAALREVHAGKAKRPFWKLWSKA